MSIGERQFQSSLRYPIQNQRTPQNDINQSTFANNLYQQIVDKNKNNYLPTSNFSSMNNSYSQNTINFTPNNSQFSSSYSSNRFNILLTSLESKNNENHEYYTKIENQNTIISNKANEINQYIHDLRSKIDTFSSFQINRFLQPLSEKNRSKRDEIESFFSNFHSSSLHFLNKNLNEFVTSFFIFDDKFNKISNDITKSGFQSLQRDLNKIKNITRSNLNQIDKIDSIFDTRIITLNQKIANLFEEKYSKSSKNYELFENNINDKFKSVTNEISEALKQESSDRDSLVLSYQKQIEEIQNKVKKPLLKFQSALKNFHNENSPVLNDLKESIKKSLDSSQDECSQMIMNLNESYESVIDETENNFNNLQTEISNTINLIREKNESEISSILNIIETELNVQKASFEIEKEKISKFMTPLNDQIELNLNKFELMAKGNESNGLFQFNNLYEEQIQPKIEYFSNFESNLNEIEKRIVECENSIENTVSKMKLNIIQSNDKIIEITRSLDDFRIVHKGRLDLIDTNVHNIEERQNSLSQDKRLISADYISQANSIVVDELNKRVDELENQFGQLICFFQNYNFFNTKTDAAKIESDKENNELTASSTSNNSNNENEDTKEFTSSQLYSDSFNYVPTPKNESDEGDDTFSTNTLTENPKNNQLQNKIQDNEADNCLSDSKIIPDDWNVLSNSDADDEGTEEFTFNKSLNNSINT